MSPGKQGERLMTLAELAGYLHMSKKTVLKLATDKKVPGVFLENEWRFRRGDIDQWLSEQQDSDIEDFEDAPDGMEVPLGDIMPQPAIVHDLRSKDALGVIEELAARAYSQRWLNDKPWFVGALLEREALASTAMEGGVAFLHTRSRDTRKIKQPFVICGRSYTGIDFGAPDGKPTFLFFLLGLKYDRLHLPILGRLARLTMRNPTVVTSLRATTSPVKMRNLLLQLDAEELSSAQVAPAVYRPQSSPQLDRKERLRAIMRVNARKKYEAKKAEETTRKAERRATRRAEKAKAASTTRATGKTAAAAKKAAATKKAATKKATTKKAATKKAATKKAATKKAATKKKAAPKRSAASKKTAAAKKKTAATKKKAAAKKSTAAKKTAATKKKAAAKKSTAAKKSAAAKKKAAAKKGTAAKKKSAATKKKAAAKKSPAAKKKSAAAKKSTAKKSAATRSKRR